MEVKAKFAMCLPITLRINSLGNVQLTCLVHVPLKFLCGLALPFAVLSIVWQPVSNEGMEQVSLASFAKATELSTMGKQNQDTSVNGSGFGFFFFCTVLTFGFCFLHYSSEFKISSILTSDRLQSQALFHTVNYKNVF